MTTAGVLLVSLGGVLLMVAGLGLFLLPDALARQHAATKAGTLALGLTMVGVALIGGTLEWAWRAAVVVFLLFATLPVSSHMLARAAARELYEPEDLEVAGAPTGEDHASSAEGLWDRAARGGIMGPPPAGGS